MKTIYKCTVFLALVISSSAFGQNAQNKPTTSATQQATYWQTNGNAGIVPSVNFLGTTDTNRLVFRTNNIERATILVNGNFGVGTPNPTKTFFIQGANTAANSELYVKQVAGSTLGAYLSLDNTANPNGKWWSIGSTGSTNFPGVNGSLEFYQFGVGTRMIIDTFGHLGIGVIKPTAQLHTTGTVRFAGLTNKTGIQRFLGVDSLGNVYYTTLSPGSSGNWSLTGNAGTNSGTNFIGTTDTAKLVFKTNNVQRMVMLSNGNVGIGNSSPNKTVIVQGNTTAQNAELSVKQVSSTTLGAYVTLDNTANAYGKSWSIGSTGSTNFPGVNGSLEFYQLGAGTRMIIDSFGHLGIGVLKPTAQLHTTGTVRFAGLTSKTGVQRFLATDSLGNVYYTTLNSGSAGNWALAGNAGTTPSVNFLGTTDTARLAFRTNNSQKMVILSNGTVGIGTPSPNKTVVIQGNITTQNAELSVKQGAGTTLGAYLTLDNTSNTNGKLWSIGSTGSLNYPGVNGSLEFYQYGAGTRMIIDSFGRVGVGVLKPSAQFHTTGSVRFAGLTSNTSVQRILGVDSLGNVFYTTPTSSSGGNSWSLTGNAGTTPGTNFIGTTDAQSLVFKTNNTARITILTTGYTGINTSTPLKLLSLAGANTADNAEIQVKQLTGSTLGAYLTLDNTANGGQWWSIGSTGSTNSTGASGMLEFYQYGYGTRMLMDPTGKLGLALGNGILPSATLHVNGSVRLQNLPTGGGNILVVDNQGYVHVSSNSEANAITPSNTDAVKAVDDLQQEVNDLKEQVIELKAIIKVCSPGIKLSDNAALFQNVPNPSSASSTVIKLYVPENKSGELVVTDMTGNVRKRFSSLQSGTQQVSVSGGELGSGTYVYSLYINGQLFQSKKMIIAQ